MIFPDYVHIEDFLDKHQIDELRSLLDLDNKTDDDFVESRVFNRINKTNITNKHLRASHKIEYKDNKIFDHMQKYIDLINEQMKQCKFILIRNDVEVVQYKKGDFFKKHQDYVNFDSNEFKNYTFIINLHGCEGGSTILYGQPDTESEPYEVKQDRKNVGNIILFQKTLIHEGLPVLDGLKTLLKGNLICVPTDTNEIIIVKLHKYKKQEYVIPIKWLEHYPECVYNTAYQFHKKCSNNPICIYEEKVLDIEAMNEFYNSIQPWKSKKKMYDYLGYNLKPSIYDELIKFYNNADTFLTVTMADYYNLINWKIPKNIIPLQMVIIECDKFEKILWFGAWDNRLLTLDYYTEYYYSNEYTIENHNDDSDCDCEDTEECLLDSATNKLENLKISGFEDFVNDIERLYMHAEENIKLIDQSRKIIYNKYKLKKLDEIFATKGYTDQQKIINYVLSLIDDINSHYDNKVDNVLHIGVIPPKDCIIEKNDLKELTYNPPSVQDIDLTNFDLLEAIETIKSAPLLTKLQNARSAEFHCNETYYLTHNIIYKFGFYKC